MGKFRLTTDHFIEPNFYQRDTIIEYDGPPNVAMEPLDKAAQLMMDAYYKKYPKATINPVEDLPRSFASVVVEEAPAPTVAVVSAPKGA